MSETSDRTEQENQNGDIAGRIVKPFDRLVSQPYTARFLSQTIIAGKPSHAYMFVGPLGSGKTEGAILLAEALLCGYLEPGGAIADECIRVRRGSHPDLHVIDPEGTSGYLAEQISELIHDITLAPIRSKRKVYLLTRADLLRGTSANALLKTLEEPPPSVTFVLLARTRDAVMETILSRCQVVAFRRVPEDIAVQTICAKTGESAADARLALATTGGSVYRAIDFLRSGERKAARMEVLGVLENLDQMHDYELLEAVKKLLLVLKAPLQFVQEKQEEKIRQSKDVLGKAALSRLEKQHKRELSSHERETLGEALDTIRSWLRDVLSLRLGVMTEARELVNYDHHHFIAKTASEVSEQQIIAALASVDAAFEQIQYNVAVQLALEGMFMRIRLALSDNK